MPGPDGDARLAPFPEARWEEVEGMFRLYVGDKRNQIPVIPQIRVKFSIERPNGIFESEGTLDQVRLHDGALNVWDLKAGKSEGWDMTYMYLPQLAAYTYGLSKEDPEVTSQLVLDNISDARDQIEFEDAPVKVGGIIRLQDYIKPRPGLVRKSSIP